MLNYEKIKAFLIIGLLGSIVSLQASQGNKKLANANTGVEHAMVSAYQNNQELQEKRQEVLAGHEGIVQALASFRPTIDLNGNVSRSVIANSGDTKNIGGNYSTSGTDSVNRTAGVTLKQNLFAGGSSLAQYKGTDYAIQSSWASLLAAEQGILLQAVQAFLEVAAKQSELEVHKSNVEAMNHNYESAVAKMKSGEETLTQVSLAEGRLAEASGKMASAKAELDSARATYEKITGTPAPVHCKKPDHCIDHLPKNFDELINCALELNPNITAAQFELAAAKQDKKKVTGAMLPTLDLYASSNRTERHSSGTNTVPASKAPAVLHSKDYDTRNEVGLSASVKLYDGGSLRSQRRQAGEKAIAKRIAIEKVKQQIIEQAKQAWQNYQAAKENVVLFNKQVKAQSDALKGTQKEMEAGSKVLLDVLNAQSALLEAELRVISVEKVMLIESYKILLAMGILNVQYLNLPVEVFDPVANYKKVRRQF